MAVDMMASARIPGTRKSTGCLVPVGSTCTAEKNSRNTTGMPSVRKRVSPLVNSMVSSARSWAASGLIGPAPGARGRDAGPSSTGGVPRPARWSVGPRSSRRLPPRAPVMARYASSSDWPVRRSPRDRSRSASQPASAATTAGLDSPAGGTRR